MNLEERAKSLCETLFGADYDIECDIVLQALREAVGEKDKRIAELKARGDKLAEAVQGVIDSCVHPDKAVRAVLVDLKPLREALAEWEKGSA